jgi:2-phosphosulfolactate phosphatase
MKVEVVFLPRELKEAHVRDRAVVVFDVLRATTTMTAALAAGAKEIHVFATLDEARIASSASKDQRLLCGEVKCLPPAGFDLGNSPGAYVSNLVGGKTLFMSTTNGTRALAAARGATKLYVAALVNATAAAGALAQTGLAVTLLCAGTDGEIAPEDLIGAGAVMDELQQLADVQLGAEETKVLTTFRKSRTSLLDYLRNTTGAQNVIAVGLEEDVKFAARLNVFDVVGEVDPRNLVVRPAL